MSVPTDNAQSSKCYIQKNTHLPYRSSYRKEPARTANFCLSAPLQKDIFRYVRLTNRMLSLAMRRTPPPADNFYRKGVGIPELLPLFAATMFRRRGVK